MNHGPALSLAARRTGSRAALAACACLILACGILSAPALARNQGPVSSAQIIQAFFQGTSIGKVDQMVAKSGIDFVPSPHFLEVLQEAGANGWFNTELQKAKRLPGGDVSSAASAPQAGAAESQLLKPLAPSEVLSIIHRRVPDARILRILDLYRVGFSVDDKFLQAASAAGADPTVLSALAAAKLVAPYSPQSVPRRLIVSREVMEGKVKKAAPIFYPPRARLARIVGTVRIQAIIGTDGKVEHVSGVVGHPLLVPAALRAVKGSRFYPTVVSTTSGASVPVEVVTVVEVRFNL